ncbi:hypothetical protein CBR_g21212 [Chara braunii]|uniref:Reverse transcriptase domain-containing protein n=1 Tax=Chara braunii TaxID=69332 RepID=A0A388L0Y4_CHABU|nr:hypothetical protein CBR_g21212 [Chara braunii]|eukprot:GBG75970.1 hypothetical protein CBR_g21212 [Chara braunii]
MLLHNAGRGPWNPPGRSFLSRTETVMFNKHDGTLILLLCDPACGNYEIITCRNTGPRSIRNRPNPGSFTIEESEGERWRLGRARSGREGESIFPQPVRCWEGHGPGGHARDGRSGCHPGLEGAGSGMPRGRKVGVGISAPRQLKEPSISASTICEPAFLRRRLKQGSQRQYKTVDKKCRPVPVLVTEDKEAYYERERRLIRRMRESALAGPCRINEGNERESIIGEPNFLLPRERALIVELMKRRHRAYAFSDEECGRLDVDKIPIIRNHTVPHEPWNMRRARFLNPDEEKKVVDYLDGKIRTHVADYSSGPYASPWFCFIKPNGTLRWVQNLQRLNAVTVRDAGGLPNADALSESCAGRPIISLIDLYSGYDQFPVYPPDRPVMAMHTPRGLIHMNVAPQGWTNAEAMTQRAMIQVMQSVSPYITQPYIDDLAMKGPAMKESDEVSPGVRLFVWKHTEGVEKVLGLLKKHNLTASGAKSRHCKREATILGFVCSEKSRRPDAKKTDKITEWPILFHSITDVRSFLGGGKGTRPPQRPLGASGGYERHEPRHRESTSVYDDGDIELFLDNFWDHARRMGWTVAETIERLRGAGRFEEPITRIRKEATTRQEVEARMEELRPSPVGPDGRPIRLEIGNAANFIPAFEWFMRGKGKEVIEVGEDTPPQTPAVGFKLGDAPGSTRQAGKRLQTEEAPLPSSGKAPSPEGDRAERRRERAVVRREALILIDRHLAAHALEHPDLEEPVPAEPRQEPCQPEKEMEAEIPKKVELLTRKRAPAGETVEEKRARRIRRIDEIWQERQRLEAAGELPEQQQERQRSEAAGALPSQPPSAPARAPEIPEMWRDFWEQRGEKLPSPVRAGFGVARKAEERLDRKIKFLANTTFDRHLLLESDLAGKKMKEASHGVRLEAMEVEIQELRALVVSQAAIIESLRQQTQGEVNNPESNRQGEKRQPGHGLPRQPSAAEPRQEPPMGRVILEPEEARAQRQAGREAFEFKAPTELSTLRVAAAGPIVPLAVEEGLPPSSSEPAQGSAEGSIGMLLEAVHTMQEEMSLFSTEQRIEEPLEREMGNKAEGTIKSRLQRMGTHEYGPEKIEEQPTAVPRETLERRPQRLDTPEYVPATRDLRSRLGSWATGSGSGGQVHGIEQQEFVSTAAPRSEQQGVVSTLVGSPSSPPPQPRKKKFKGKVD